MIINIWCIEISKELGNKNIIEFRWLLTFDVLKFEKVDTKVHINKSWLLTFDVLKYYKNL